MTPQEKLNEAAFNCANIHASIPLYKRLISDFFKQGALSPEAANGCNKHVEIAKIEFAIKKLYEFRNCTFGKGKDVINELEQQLENLKQQK